MGAPPAPRISLPFPDPPLPFRAASGGPLPPVCPGQPLSFPPTWQGVPGSILDDPRSATGDHWSSTRGQEAALQQPLPLPPRTTPLPVHRRHTTVTRPDLPTVAIPDLQAQLIKSQPGLGVFDQELPPSCWVANGNDLEPVVLPRRGRDADPPALPRHFPYGGSPGSAVVLS